MRQAWVGPDDEIFDVGVMDRSTPFCEAWHSGLGHYPTPWTDHTACTWDGQAFNPKDPLDVLSTTVAAGQRVVIPNLVWT